MIAAIVAVDADWGIGYNGELLEHIPEDMKRFRELTNDNIIFMGRKTQESLPNKKLLNRINIVITNKFGKEIIGNKELMFMDMSNIIFYLNGYSIIQNEDKRDIYIIGGESIYKQLLPYCDTLYITRINKRYDYADTYFPDISSDNSWKLIEQSELKQYKDLTYCFETYKRL